jgi:hypothetical protein
VNEEENIVEEESSPSEDDSIKDNIKMIYKKINQDPKSIKDRSSSDKLEIEKKYKNDNDSHEFVLHVNSNTCSMPLFNLRTYEDLGYYFNFIIHNFDTKKINNLIMCKDIHKWMSSSSLSNEDLGDELIPIYFVKKVNDKKNIYEYVKIFVHSDPDGTKNAFVQKGSDYLLIEHNINQLIQKGFIKNILDGKEYINYNLSSHDGVCNFLENFLSIVLVPSDFIGKSICLDIENYEENKQTYEYHFNTVNSDLNVFNTTI